MFWRKKSLKPKIRKRIEILGTFYQEALRGLADETKIEYDEKFLIYHKAKFEGACEVLDLTIDCVNGYNFNVNNKARFKVVTI